MKNKKDVPKLIEKSLGNGGTILVTNPDLYEYNDEGFCKKRRNPMTHLTPKKKKRK